MATVNATPNSDDTPNQWIPTGSVNHFENIDENPAAPNTTDYNLAGEATASHGDKEEYGFTNADIEAGVTSQIVVWTYGRIIGSGNPEVRLGTGGAWQGSQEVNFTGLTSWKSNTFTVAWNQAQVDAMQVEYTADCSTKDDMNYLYTVYAVITYAAVVEGWGHSFMGTPAANVGSINGTLLVNIKSMKGVDI